MCHTLKVMAVPPVHVRVGPQGRIVVPAELRKALDMAPGERLIARVENGCLIFERPDHVIARLQQMFMDAVPRDVSLVDELIAERRAEAAREAAE